MRSLAISRRNYCHPDSSSTAARTIRTGRFLVLGDCVTQTLCCVVLSLITVMACEPQSRAPPRTGGPPSPRAASPPSQSPPGSPPAGGQASAGSSCTVAPGGTNQGTCGAGLLCCTDWSGCNGAPSAQGGQPPSCKMQQLCTTPNVFTDPNTATTTPLCPPPPPGAAPPAR